MHLHFKLAAIAAAVLSTVNAQAADKERAPEVVVTATRTPTRVNELLSDVSVITRDDIEHTPATSLVELLSTISGVSVTSNGGRGANTSLFIRGSNTNHSVVLVDGQRISSATTGTTAFEHLPLDQIERIEVLRGPASSLYGADAIGGVIQIFTRKGAAGKPAPSFSFGAGSYRTTTGAVSYGGSVGDTRFNLSGGWENSHGPSSAKAPNTNFYNTYNPDRDAYANTNVAAHISQRLSPNAEIGGDYLETSVFKHFDATNCDPSGFIFCTPDFDSRQHQKLRSYSAFAAHQLSSDWKSSLRIGRSDDLTKSWLIEPLSAQVTIDHFNTAQTQFSWQNDFTTRYGRIMAAAEWRKEEVDTSKALIEDSRTTKAMVVGYQGRFGQHDLQASARIDDIERIGSARSGTLAYGYHFASGLSAHASLGRAFHAPTFNDLYWPLDLVNFFQGNPNLHPERAFNREIGLRYDTAFTTTQLNFFHNKVTDLLDYVSDPTTFIGTYQNLNRATLRGASFNYTLCQEAWTLRTKYDFLSARADATGRFLQRRVPHSGLVEVRRQFSQFDLGAQVTYAGDRFNNNANTQTLDSFSLLNLDASYPLTPEWRLQAKLGNVFNTDYVLAKEFSGNDYSTPGRTFFMNVRYQPK